MRFLRGCAQAADEGELGVMQGRLLVNGDLMREAANQIEKDNPAVKDTTELFRFHVVRAENHARWAFDLLYDKEGPARSLWVRMALGRAQSILMSLWKQELRRKTRVET